MCTFCTSYNHVVNRISWKVLEKEFYKSWKTPEFGLCKSLKVLKDSVLLTVRTLCYIHLIINYIQQLKGDSHSEDDEQDSASTAVQVMGSDML